jgi:hypothetical protein
LPEAGRIGLQVSAEFHGDFFAVLESRRNQHKGVGRACGLTRAADRGGDPADQKQPFKISLARHDALPSLLLAKSVAVTDSRSRPQSRMARAAG